MATDGKVTTADTITVLYLDCTSINEITYDKEMNYFVLDFVDYYNPKSFTYADRATNCNTMIHSSSIGNLGSDP